MAICVGISSPGAERSGFISRDDDSTKKSKNGCTKNKRGPETPRDIIFKNTKKKTGTYGQIDGDGAKRPLQVLTEKKCRAVKGGHLVESRVTGQGLSRE